MNDKFCSPGSWKPLPRDEVIAAIGLKKKTTGSETRSSLSAPSKSRVGRSPSPAPKAKQRSGSQRRPSREPNNVAASKKSAKSSLGCLAKEIEQLGLDEAPGVSEAMDPSSDIPEKSQNSAGDASSSSSQQEYVISQMDVYPAKLRGQEKQSELESFLQPTEHFFRNIPEPEVGDWLYSTHEAGQSFEQYVGSRPNKPSRQQNVIYILPFSEPKSDSMKTGSFPCLSTLESFISKWFDLPCKTLPHEAVHKDRTVGKRRNGHGTDQQYCANDILRKMEAKVPKDAYCLIGVTMDDIWSGQCVFVFGLASLRNRVGVFSFCRQDPAWYRLKCTFDMDTMKTITTYAKERQVGDADIILRRAHWTMAHEIGHMFGFAHCVYFKCTMQGSNGLTESDARSSCDLCPVCLRKLSWCVATGSQRNPPTNVAAWCMERYQRLQEHYQQVGTPMAQASRWLEARLAFLSTGAAPLQDIFAPVANDAEDDSGAPTAKPLDAFNASEAPAASEAAIEPEFAEVAMDVDVPPQPKLASRQCSGCDLEIPESSSLATLAVKLKTLFEDYDAKQERSISRDKLQNVLKQCNPSFTQQELDTLFDAVDKNKNGIIEYDELVDFVCSQKQLSDVTAPC